MSLKFRDKYLPVLIILAGVSLRFFHLTSKSLWCDEFLAISLSRLNFSDMLSWIIRNDAHPPFFYSIIRFFFRFTQSELGLRFIPALFGGGSLYLFYLLLKKTKPANFLQSLTLFALSPAAILWSQTVKSYSMLTFFSLLSVITFLDLKRTRRLIYAVGWVFSSLMVLYLHNYGIVIIIAQTTVLLLARKKESSLRIFFLPASVILLLYLPYLLGPLFSQIFFVKGATHTVTNPFLRCAYLFYYFIFGETLSPLNLIFVLPGISLFLFFFLSGLFSRGDFIHLFSLILCSTAVILIFSVNATIPQNLMHIQPFFFITVASGIAKISNEKRRTFFYSLLILFLLPALFYYYKGDSQQYHDPSRLIPYRQISQMIQKEERAGEVIIITEGRETRFSEYIEPYAPLDWYYKGALPIVEVSAVSVENQSDKLIEIYDKYSGYWLVVNYGFSEKEWNDRVKDFFLKGKSVKIRELKLLKNYSFLGILKGEKRENYYFLELYHMIKEDG